MAKVTLRPISKCRVRFGIRSTSPLVMHKWSEKAKEMMRQKHAGKKTRERENRKPEQEARDAAYTTTGGDLGIPAMALKNAILSAAHKDLGVERTLVRKALFIVCDDANKVIPMECDDPIVQEDPVRVGAGSTDLRYRPRFDSWKATVELEVDGELLGQDDVLTLVNRAGFGVGICEWRPEKSGEYGRFEIDPDVPVMWKSWGE